MYIHKLCIFAQLFALPGLIQFHYYTINELFCHLNWLLFSILSLYNILLLFFISVTRFFLALALAENCLFTEGNNKNAWVEKYQLNCRRAAFRKKMKWKMRSSWNGGYKILLFDCLVDCPSIDRDFFLLWLYE